MAIQLSDNWVRLLDVKNEKTGAFINDAAVQLLDIVDANGVRITGLTVPQTLAYIAASNGGYEYLLNRDVVTLLRGRQYLVIIDCNGGAGLRRRFEEVIPVEA